MKLQVRYIQLSCFASFLTELLFGLYSSFGTTFPELNTSSSNLSMPQQGWLDTFDVSYVH
jgi:hypothetical protein